MCAVASIIFYCSSRVLFVHKKSVSKMEENKNVDVKNNDTNESKVPNKNHGIGIRHLQVACLCLVTTSLFIVRSIMGVAVLAMTDLSRTDGPDVYAWDKETQGYILSSFFCGYVAMQLPGGLLAKRFGGKITLMVALLANGLICFTIPAFAKLGGWQLVCLCRVFMGLTQSSLIPSINTLMGRWLPSHEVTSLSGYIGGSSSLGIIISMPLSGFLSQTVLGWKLIFYFSGSLLIIVSVIWWIFSASSPGEHHMISAEERMFIEKEHSNAGSKRTPSVPWKAMLTFRGFWAICVAHVAFIIGYIFLFVDLPTYMEKGLKIPLTNSASLSALPYVGMLVGTLVFANLFDKLVNGGYMPLGRCRKLFSSIGLLGFAISLLSLAFVDSDSKVLTIGIIILSLTLQSANHAGFIVNQLDLSPNWSGVMVSLTNCMANMGSIITPIITSLILRNDPTDTSRWRVVFILVSAINIVAGVVYLIFSSAERQPWDDPSYMDNKKIQKAELKSIVYSKVDATDENTECT